MSIFEEKYSNLYELVYASKDYILEVEVIKKILSQISPQSNRVLDFGCGTGNHAKLLSENGYLVTGVDRSKAMLKRAKAKSGSCKLSFLHSDQIDEIKNGSQDVALSLFDVVSYLSEMSDLFNFFELIKKKTHGSAPLLFDFWYLPAVIHLKPEIRKKTFFNKNQSIMRVSEPTLDISTSSVRINHDFFISKDNRIVEHFSESHTMRCFTKNEISQILEHFGYRIHSLGTWEDPTKEPDLNDWSVLLVALPN